MARALTALRGARVRESLRVRLRVRDGACFDRGEGGRPMSTPQEADDAFLLAGAVCL